MDEKLQNALKQAVKSNLITFGKHILGDKSQDSESFVAIFTIHTILGEADKWVIVYEPTHEVLKVELESFMRKIIKVSGVVRRVEAVFRDSRDKIIADIKRKVDEVDKAGGNTTRTFEEHDIKANSNYQNYSEEEKDNWWKERFELPPIKSRSSYEERITNNKKIQSKIDEILIGIDAVAPAMEDDRRHW
jgi:hypothetical protein